MGNWSWKEGLQFAFASKLLPKEEGGFLAYEMNLSEKLGSLLLKPLYRMIESVSKNIKEPVAICLFTLLAALIAGLAFYNMPAIVILGKLFPLELVRGMLFFYVELNLFAMGCRAFGRFNNEVLINLWKKGLLIPVFPGDLMAQK